MEPIECSVPDTPSYDTPSYDHIWFHKHKMMLYTSESPLLLHPPTLASNVGTTFCSTKYRVVLYGPFPAKDPSINAIIILIYK